MTCLLPPRTSLRRGGLAGDVAPAEPEPPLPPPLFPEPSASVAVEAGGRSLCDDGENSVSFRFAGWVPPLTLPPSLAAAPKGDGAAKLAADCPPSSLLPRDHGNVTLSEGDVGMLAASSTSDSVPSRWS